MVHLQGKLFVIVTNLFSSELLQAEEERPMEVQTYIWHQHWKFGWYHL